MPTYKYPSLDTDRPEHVLGLLGSLWTHYYGGRKPLLAMTIANLELLKQQHQNLDEVVSCASHNNVCLYNKVFWTAIKLNKAENTEKTGVFCFPAPAGLASMSLMSNRMTDPTLVWQEGIDYRIRYGVIEFASDPFANPNMSVLGDTALLWGFNGQFDREYLRKHFGHMLDLEVSSSQKSKDTVSAIMNCYSCGTTIAEIEALLAVIHYVPTAKGCETAVLDATDRRGRFLATDCNIYRIPHEAVLSVPVGSQLYKGQPIVQTFKISELRPHRPPSDATEVIVQAGMAKGQEITVPTSSLRTNSCILLQVDLSYMDKKAIALIRRVLPPQTGLVFAEFSPALGE